MATSRHAWFPAVCAATLMGMSASGIWAEEGVTDDTFRYQDLRLGFSAIETPRIRQQKPANEEGTWDNNGNKFGTRVGLTYLRGSSETDSWLGTVWGGQFSVSTYHVGDQGFETTLIQPIVDVYYGWQYGIIESDSIRGFGELLPYLGAGISHLDVGEKSRIGGAVEGGIRAGAYLTERSWLLGITAAYQLEWSKISYTQSSKKHEIDITANGFSLGVEGGYRF